MSVLTTLGVFNYGLVLLYGLFLSTFISGGWENTKQRTLVFAACPLFLMIQERVLAGAGCGHGAAALPAHHSPAAGAHPDLHSEEESRRGAGEHLHSLPLLPAPALGGPGGHGAYPLRADRRDLLHTGDRAAVLSALPLLRPPGLRGHDGLAAVAAFIRQPAGGVLFL